MALDGDYDSACIFYSGVLQQVQKLMSSLGDPGSQSKWTMVSGDTRGDPEQGLILFLPFQIQNQIKKEFDEVKAIQRTLAEITIGMQNKPFQNKIRLPATSEMNAPNPAAWFRPDPDVWQPPNPYRDPDVWGPPPMPMPLDTR